MCNFIQQQEGFLPRVNPSKKLFIGASWNHLRMEENVPSYFNKMNFSRILPLLLLSGSFPLPIQVLLWQFRKGRKSSDCLPALGTLLLISEDASCATPLLWCSSKQALRIPPPLDVQSSALSQTSFFSSVCDFPWAVCVFKQSRVSLRPSTVSSASRTPPLVWFSLNMDC